MPDTEYTYAPLKNYVASHGGARLRMQPKMRDSIVDIAVEEWPSGCPDDKLEEVLAAKVRIRIRQKYGSFVALLLISVLSNLIVRIIVEWWKRRNANKVLMEGWSQRAKAAQAGKVQ